MSTTVASREQGLGAKSGGSPDWVPGLVYGLWTALVMAIWVLLSEAAYQQGWLADLRFIQTAPVGRGDGSVMILLPAVVLWGAGAWMLSTWMLKLRGSVTAHR